MAGETRQPGPRAADIPATRRVVAAAARRLRQRVGVNAAGVSLTVAGAVGVGLALAGWWWVWEVPWWVYPAAAGGAALVLGAVAATLTRVRPIAAASLLDDQLGFADRLSSAVQFAGGAGAGFERVAISDAERVATEASVRTAVPIELGRGWIVGGVLLLAMIGMGVGLPDRAEVVRAQREALQNQRLAAADRIREARQAIEELTPLEAESEAATRDPEDEATVRAFEELEKELESGEVDPAEAVARAAADLEKRAEQREQEASEAERRAQALDDQLRRLDESDYREASELASRLAEGDLRGAREALQKLWEKAGNASNEERDAIAREMDRLAHEIEKQNALSSESADAETGETGEQNRERETTPSQAPPNQTPSNEAPENQSPEKPTPAENAAEPDRNSAANDEAWDQRGDQPSEQQGDQQGKQPSDQAHDESGHGQNEQSGESQDESGQPSEVSDALRREAERIRQPQKQPGEGEPQNQPPEQGRGDPQSPQSEQGQQTEQGQQPEQGEKEPKSQPQPGQGEQQSDQPSDQQGEQQPSEGQPQNQPTEPREGQQQTPKPGGEGEQPGQQPKPEQGQEQSQEQSQQPQPGEGDQPAEQQGEPSEPGEGQPQGQPSQPAEGEPQNPQPQPGGEQQQPNEQPQPGGQGGQPREQPQRGGEGDQQQPQQRSGEGNPKNPGGERSLDEVLKDAQQQRENAAQNREQAERLREQADRLLERERQPGSAGERDPNQPESKDPWSRAIERERGDPTGGSRAGEVGDESQRLPPTGEAFERTDPVDARPEDARGTAQTIDQWLGEGQDGEYTPEAREQMRDAVKSAERAVEQQRVPTRHEQLIRRVFKRWQQRAEGESIPPLGSDAVPTGGSSNSSPGGSSGDGDGSL